MLKSIDLNTYTGVLDPINSIPLDLMDANDVGIANLSVVATTTHRNIRSKR